MLQERVFSVKKRFLAMYHKAHAGHIGSSLSCAELLVFLKLGWMREADTLVLSKGHAAAALYSLFAEVGRLTPSQIDSFYEDGTLLSALPPVGAIEGIPFATGSLGYESHCQRAEFTAIAGCEGPYPRKEVTVSSSVAVPSECG